jgi:hypothetical protein
MRTPGVSYFGIPTCNRPELLERGLGSFIRNAQVHSHDDVEFVVLDDSFKPESREVSLEILRRLKASTGAKIRYIGRASRSKWAKTLAREAGIAQSTTSFAVEGVTFPGYGTYGANRNTFLLHSTGADAISADDDFVCLGARGAGHRLGGRPVFSDETGVVFQFFANERTLPRPLAHEDYDVLGTAESLIGKPASKLLGSSKARGKVILAKFGVYGDSGLGFPGHVLELEGGTRKRVMRSVSFYRAAIRNRMTLYAAPRPTLASASSFWGTGAFAFDNEVPIPPFMPLFAGEDNGTSPIVAATMPEMAMAFMPLSLRHWPVPARRTPAGIFRESSNGISFHFLFSELLKVSLREQDGRIPGSTAQRRLTRLGELLSQSARMPLPEVSELLKRGFQRNQRIRLLRYEKLLSKYREKPAFWAKDVRTFLRGLARQTPGGDRGLIIRELQSGNPMEDLAFALSLLERFAEILEAWPEMRDAALRLKKKDKSLGEEV